MADPPGPKRITIPVLQVIDLLLAEPGRDDWFALEVCRRTGLGSGTVAQILLRLQEWSWVTDRWEDAAEAHRQGRPRRRFYRLTGLGASQARDVVRRRFPGIARWAAT
jgi:PadR family transcriptional regulator PadR